MKKLVLIDGKSVFYRGYYAMGALSLSDGTPTGGVYGFAAIAMEIVKRLAPTKVVVAWDSKDSTVKRRAIYPEYKAGRHKPGEDFYAQIPLLEELVGDLGWTFVEVPEYEADDIIGTLSRQADENTKESETPYLGHTQGRSAKLKVLDRASSDSLGRSAELIASEATDAEPWETYIISSDLDMLQIVDDNTHMWRIMKGFTDIRQIDVKEIEAKYGIKKSQFLDLKALKGDASDNIPGVPGVGEKTAAKLLNEYGDLDGVYAHIDEIKGAVQKKLIAGKESAYMSRDLAKIMFDAPVLLAEIPDFEFDRKKMIEGLKKLEFKSLIRKFAGEDDVVMDDKKEVETEATRLDRELVPVLHKMEKRGMLIDRGYFAKLKQEYTKKVEQLKEEIWKLAEREFNVNSPVQLSEVLFEDLKLPTKGIKKTTRGYSTGIKELEKLKGLHPVIEKIMEYREASKLLSTYIVPMPELADADGRIHTTFTQDVTATGRLSSKDPNLQNIPVRTEEGRRIRTGFVAPPGKVLVSADYSQFELRLAAVLAGDKALTDDFNQGVDIHTKTAAEAFRVPIDAVTKEQRRAAKVINFGVLYGMSVKGLSDAAGMSIGEAKAFIENYFKLRAPIKEYLDKVLKQAREKGYVETYYGRRRLTPDVKSPNFLVRQAAKRAAQNMPIQGTEADLMKKAMIAVDAKLPKGAELIMQVHDSLIVECQAELADEAAKILRHEMENVAPELKIKLATEVTIGKNWGEL